MADAADLPSTPSQQTQRSSLRKFLPLFLLLALLLLVWLLRSRIHFDWKTLGHELRHVSLLPIGIGCGSIYLCYWLRAMRWRVLLGANAKISSLALVPAQLIGFTMVALFGRVVDLARPWLIARRTGTPAATQLAVYSIERAFDLGAAAILFSLALAFAPHNMPHHETFAHAGEVSLAATLFLALFAVSLRFFGEFLARLAKRLLHPLSAELADSLSIKILDFRQGLAVSSMKALLISLVLSLVMWMGIALAYREAALAFPDTPTLATFSIPATMLLLATGMGSSLLQLPIIGWFSQIALLALALNRFFDVPAETATACGAVNVFVTTLCVIPAGLIAARMQGIGLRDTARNADGGFAAE